MKVKNIMFAGFASAILSGVCGAASAADYNLVTEGYVTEKLSGKADTGVSYTKAEADDLLGGKVSTETYAAYIETQEGVDEAQDAKIQANTAAIDGLSGVDGTGFATMQQDITTLKTAMTGEGEGSVAQKISTALTGYATEEYVGTAVETATSGMLTKTTADAEYAPASLSQTVTDLSATVANKADASELANYVETSTLTAYQGEVTEALAGKASTQSVTELSATVEGKADASELANYVETSTLTAYQGEVTEALAGKASTQSVTDLSATVANKADASELANYVETSTLTTYQGEVTQALAAKANTSDVDTALEGKLDVMENAGTYLVKRDGEGNISYVSVEIVGETPAQGL